MQKSYSAPGTRHPAPNKRAQMDLSFSWIFALIIGAFIIFGAVYGVSKFSKMSEQKISSETAMDLGSFLNPLETSVEAGKTVYIKLPLNSRIYNSCDKYGTFGSQGLSVQEFIKEKWSAIGAESTFRNKYLYSSEFEEGRGFYAFSKPFDYPFKVANLIYITSADEKYCFISPSPKIKKELTELKQENLLVNDCSTDEDAIKVCFSGVPGCDMVVNYNSKYVKKGLDTMYFSSDSLMYAAIFSDFEIYECVTERLVKRALQLVKIYQRKSLLVSSAGCVSEVLPSLEQLNQVLSSYTSSKDLSGQSQLIKTIENENSYARCNLW